MEEIDVALSIELVCVCQDGNLKKVRYIISSGIRININLQGVLFGYTPIMDASRFGHFEIVKVLLYQDKYHININIKNVYGKTAIDVAEERGYTEIVKIIEDYISFIKDFQTLLLIFYRKEILPNEIIDMIIKIRRLIEINL